MNKSKIEWTEITWNPVTGCNKVSDGCKYCYAERWAKMQQKRGILQYTNGFKLTLAPNRLNDPYKWKNNRMVFVNSMSDLFHEDVNDSYIESVFDVMNKTPQHVYQILTKRIHRLNLLPTSLQWSNNIWLGTTVENNDYTFRIDELKKAKAKVKFISFEPLIGSINYENFSDIDWILVGGESGGNARKIEKEWIMSIMDTCIKYEKPFFFKQWGKRMFNPNQNDPTLDPKHSQYSKGGCMIDNNLFRNFPKL